jgi:hypothetical protein
MIRMILTILKTSTVIKGCKYSLYALKYIWINNCNRDPRNKSVLKLRSDQNEIQHQQAVCGQKENEIVQINTINFIA